jgi:hypothetical protein
MLNGVFVSDATGPGDGAGVVGGGVEFGEPDVGVDVDDVFREKIGEILAVEFGIDGFDFK